MTTNSQNLTFGEWLAAGGIPPSVFEVLPLRYTGLMYDEWAKGWPPYTPPTGGKQKDPRSNS